MRPCKTNELELMRAIPITECSPEPSNNRCQPSRSILKSQAKTTDVTYVDVVIQIVPTYMKIFLGT